MSAPGDRLEPGGGAGLIRGAHHIDPPCRHYPICGGCQLQHVDDESLSDFVRDRVVGALMGQGVTPGLVHAPHISPPNSRRRASLRAARFGKNLHLGFASEGSHRIVDMQMCFVLHPALFALVAPIRTLLHPMVSDRRAVHVRMTLTDQGVDLLLEGIEVEGLAATEALTDFAQAYRLARLTIDDGYGPQTRWEPDPVTVSFGGVAVPFPPFAFLQATADGEAALVEAVRPAIGPAARFADLFSGLGTFALSLRAGKAVYTAEGARDLVLALKSGANRSGRQMAVDHRDLFRRPLMPAELERFDAILLDPPRAGAREQAMQLAQSQVPVIAYVSCNPGSFARDAKLLVEAGYVLESVQPVGQFRWSTHVELAGVFRR
ncbi:MAG: class I SAM-dependent RNA methyltransferase [Sphingobium sp.]|uniref:class I SAM-dependent RNA methyltransferase n=1 Tax=Sphingobium sp. TaxID=1912891 RepID=UPI0029A42DEA|nr:class I SAM-dependent RNA methyltransferase [Sphingobium sp.]MDX3908509.1 class I SAM-dependent RNA methyltransferase [Sphingobium sp.]